MVLSLDEMRTKNKDLKDELTQLNEQVTEVQDDSKGNLTEDSNQASESMKAVGEKLGSIDSEISHLEEPLDKILTCVGRM